MFKVKNKETIVTHLRRSGVFIVNWEHIPHLFLVLLLLTLSIYFLAGKTSKGDTMKVFNPFQPSVAPHIETSHLICTENQIAGFSVPFNTWLKWIEKNMDPILSIIECEFWERMC